MLTGLETGFLKGQVCIGSCLINSIFYLLLTIAWYTDCVRAGVCMWHRCLYGAKSL